MSSPVSFVPDCVRATRALLAGDTQTPALASPNLHKVLEDLHRCGEGWVKGVLIAERAACPVLFSDYTQGEDLQAAVASGADPDLRLRAIVHAIGEALDVAHRFAGGFTDIGDPFDFENPNLHNGFLKVVLTELADLVAEFDSLTSGGER